MTRTARMLRHDMTDAERRLWSRIRGRQLGAYFRRQAPLERYVLDFVCFPARLVIEVDGGQHAESAADRVRDAWLKERGFRVLRFWNNEVLGDIEGVLEATMSALEDARSRSCLPPPPPSPMKGEGVCREDGNHGGSCMKGEGVCREDGNHGGSCMKGEGVCREDANHGSSSVKAEAVRGEAANHEL
ncbi:MAG: hypothetical protein COW56_01950 [Rhodocyclales bacterium CG17_big_fil_post_rev_8_21_14_2_50_68_7]|nr:MAG: hypothetical protein COW56_01950 [Rhodocyclales bacterium CG17_big_fil_post_rev_8_21_14_2_50_68_7]